MDQSFLYENGNSRLARLGNTAIKKLDSQQKNRKPYNYNDVSLRSKTQIPTDSLQSFQTQLDSILVTRSRNVRKAKPKRVEQELYSKTKEIDQLKSELDQIKILLDQQKTPKIQTPAQQKLDRLIAEIEGKKSPNELQLSLDNVQFMPNPYNQMSPPPPQYYPQQYQSPQSYPFFYPFPMPYPNQAPPTQSRRRNRRRQYDYSDSQSQDSYESRKKKPRMTQPVQRSKKSTIYQPRRDKLLKKFRAAAFAVAFTTFIKSETRKLSTNRKANMKKFLTDKFDSQMNHLKNWLLDAFKYSLSIILEKSSLMFKLDSNESRYNGTNRTNRSFMSSKVKSEKEKLLMQIIQIGLTKLLEDSTPQKLSMFAELIVYLCRKNSFALGRFWSAYEMEQLSISEQFGFIRMDQALEKYLIGILIFIKVLIFNMFLQPHKFDAENFPKNKQPLQSNMMYIGSILYHITKEVIEEFRDKERNSKIYKTGNWLQVRKQYIAECCEPMIFGRSAPEQGEYISGLVSLSEISQLKGNKYWDESKEKIGFILEKVYKQMFSKAKLMRKNLKYKLYN